MSPFESWTVVIVLGGMVVGIVAFLIDRDESR